MCKEFSRVPFPVAACGRCCWAPSSSTGLALGVVGLFLIGGRGWYDGGAFHVRAGFHEIRGVEVGTRVRLKGMDAGEVVAVLPPERIEEPVVLRLLLRGEYRRLVRPDAVVRIESDGLVGGKVLEIKPGKPHPGDAAADGLVAEDQLLQGDSSDLMEDVGAALNGVQAGQGFARQARHRNARPTTPSSI